MVQEGAAYFITSTIVEWLPVFIEEHAILILADTFKTYIKKYGLRIAAYVIMPTHLHLIVYDASMDIDRLRRTISNWRRHSGKVLSRYVDQHLDPSFGATLRVGVGDDRIRKFWSAGFHPVAIMSREFLEQKAEYMHNNPVRRGLADEPSDWPNSSAAFYEHGEIGLLPVSPLEL
jgi:putative transposase